MTNFEISLSVPQNLPQLQMGVEEFKEVVILPEKDHTQLEHLDYASSGHTGFEAAGHLPFVADGGVLVVWSESAQGYVNSGVLTAREVVIPQSLLNTIRYLQDDVRDLAFVANVGYDPTTHNWTITYRDGSTKVINIPADNFLSNVVYDEETDEIAFTMSDGTTFAVNIADLIDVYEPLENGGLGLDGNKFYVSPKGVSYGMLADNVINAFATKSDLSELGYGDMLTAVYDPQGIKLDVFAYAQPKEAGKGLSTNDYTTGEKSKVLGVAVGATKTEASTTNGNVKINGVETKVYDGSTKVDKVAGLGLSEKSYTATEQSKLGGVTVNATKTEASGTNGYIKINGGDVRVYNDAAVLSGLLNKADTMYVGWAGALNALDSAALNSGFYTISDGSSLGLTGYWWHIIHARHKDNNGFNAQIALGLNAQNTMLFRTSAGTTWGAWQNVGMSDDDKMILAGIDNLQHLKGCTSTFNQSATQCTQSIYKNGVLRAKRVSTFSVSNVVTTETFYNSVGAQVSVATKTFDSLTMGFNIS